MSSDGRHPNGPDAHLLVSLHELLEAGQGADAPWRHVGEVQLRLARLPPLNGAFFLTRFYGRLAEGEGQAVAIAHASQREDGRGRREAACIRLIGMGGRAATGVLWRRKLLRWA